MAGIVVIGGGVSGLATACALMRRGHDVTVLERQINTGGNAVSLRSDGFLMEQGPTTINAAFPAANQWVSDLGLAEDSVDLGAGVRNRYLRDHRGLYGIPPSIFGFFRSAYLSPGAKFAMLREFSRRKKTDGAEESIHAFVTRRFGREFADKVIDPMAAGIFMGDSKALSIGGAFPRLAEMEQRFGSITRGILASKRGKEPGRRLFSWPGGIGVLPQTMTRRLGKRIRTGVAVTRLKPAGTGFDVVTAADGTINASAVVLAVQPHVASMLLESFDHDGAQATGAIAAPPVSVVFLGYKRDQVSHPLDGLGFLSVNGTGVISGVQFNSTMFPCRAPEGHVALSAYVGGARNPGLARAPGADLMDAVRAELAGQLEINGPPFFARVHHWPRGLPQYSLGHSERQRTIRKTPARIPGLFLTGNYLDGVSIAACLKSAGETAALVDALVSGKQAQSRPEWRPERSAFRASFPSGRP